MKNTETKENLSVLGNSWNAILKDEINSLNFAELAEFIRKERSSRIPIYPPRGQVFNAFHFTPFEKVKVVILGQDPYHGPGQAHGLCFSVDHGVPPPPSLINIFKERKDDLGIPLSSHGSLISWAKQGVLLLNTVLTVREKEPFSHRGKGWEKFTDVVITKLVKRKDPVIFVLWGRPAKEKCQNILKHYYHSNHFVLQAPHPSPLSAYRGFFGCRHFSKINLILKNQNKNAINWHN